MTPDDLLGRITRFPRVPLASLPTPLHDAPRMASDLGLGRLLLKREDLSGFAMGGNKGRCLELVMADAVAQNATAIISGGDAQSNNCRQIAAAAAVLNLRCHLVLTGEAESPPQGNLLLDTLFGATIHRVDVAYDDLKVEMEALKRTLEREEGVRAAFVSQDLRPKVRAAAAFAGAFVELLQQSEQTGGHPDRIYIGSSGNSFVGMTVAARALGLSTRIVGVSPMGTRAARGTTACDLAQALVAEIGLGLAFTPDQFDIEDGYLEPRYGLPSPASLDAMKYLARLEGIVADPIYSGRCLAALIHDARAGRIAADETVVAVHTGGLPTVFAFAEVVAAASY